MILLLVGLNHVVHTALQHAFHNLVRYHCLNDDTLATAENPDIDNKG